MFLCPIFDGSKRKAVNTRKYIYIYIYQEMYVTEGSQYWRMVRERSIP